MKIKNKLYFLANDKVDRILVNGEHTLHIRVAIPSIGREFLLANGEESDHLSHCQRALETRF